MTNRLNLRATLIDRLWLGLECCVRKDSEVQSVFLSRECWTRFRNIRYERDSSECQQSPTFSDPRTVLVRQGRQREG